MRVAFEASFTRDLKKSRNKRIYKKVQQVIVDVKSAQSIIDLVDLKKIQGHETYYRIRLGDYRIGVEIVDN